MEREVYETFSAVEDQHWWFIARRQFLRQLILRLAGPGGGGINCEIGCGTGGNLSMLAEFAPLDAIEMDARGRELAAERHVQGVRSIQSGALPDDLPVSGPYQMVFSLDVVEHVQDDAAAVASLAHLLNEDGLLLITVPAYQWMWSYHDEINQHVRRYSRNEIVRIVEQAGLQVVYSSYFNTVLAPLAMMARGLDGLLRQFSSERPSVGLKMPPLWLNRVMAFLFGLERFVAGRLSLPFGLSVVVAARSGSTTGRQRDSGEQHSQ